MAIYSEHHPDPKDIPPPVTPTQNLADCLLHARPCKLLIDGHNLLPRLKPLIRASYFEAGQGPTAQARALLIERVKTLTALNPLLQADIWFDGPDDQDWSETDNLRVWFSGGQGSGRAMVEFWKACNPRSIAARKQPYWLLPKTVCSWIRRRLGRRLACLRWRYGLC